MVKEPQLRSIINVSKSFLPDKKEYARYLDTIWETGWLTNNGPLLKQLEEELKEYLQVKHLFFCANGTIALQIAIKVLNLTNEIITTPFSYVATTNSILWENCTPVFVDISNNDFNIDASKIGAAITPHTQAILATHVYGNPCDVNAIEAIARKNNLHVIYDAAHAFNATLNNRQVLSFGDISTCSFHATKLFHTIEGGCIITNDDELAKKILLMRQFGHIYDDYFSIGINGKNSEFHAAMGLCILPKVKKIMAERKKISEYYDSLLGDTGLQFPEPITGTEYNYSYYPVLFKSEGEMMKIKNALTEKGIHARRYFYPSLNKLPFINSEISCPISESISPRVLSLPLYYGLDLQDVLKICEIIRQNL